MKTPNIKQYLDTLNLKETNPSLVSLRKYAIQHNIPILSLDGCALLRQIIHMNQVKKILEIGTAIGYSAIAMATCGTDINIVSIERNQTLYKQAVHHVEAADKSNQITLIHADALTYPLDQITDTFDLIFIDAAKAQSTKFFEKYETKLNNQGIIVVDNVLFHGLLSTDKPLSRSLKQLIRKINDFNRYVVSRTEYDTHIYPIGDGMSVSIKR